MTFQTDIYNTVLRGKNTAGCWLECIINKEKYGDDIECCWNKLILLIQWVEILQTYYFDNWEDEEPIDPERDYIDSDTAHELLAKIKVLMKGGL